MAERGWILPERAIRSILETGLADLRAAYDDDTIDERLQRIFFNVDPAERDQIKTYLQRKPIPIVRMYPRLEQQFPCWVIALQSERQSSQYLANAGEEFVTADDEHVHVDWERWQSTYGIVTWDTNAETVVWLHHLSKYLMSLDRRHHMETFPHGQTPQGGDLGFCPMFMAAGQFVYRRTYSIAVEYDQKDVTEDSIGTIDDTANEIDAEDPFA